MSDIKKNEINSLQELRAYREALEEDAKRSREELTESLKSTVKKGSQVILTTVAVGGVVKVATDMIFGSNGQSDKDKTSHGEEVYVKGEAIPKKDVEEKSGGLKSLFTKENIDLVISILKVLPSIAAMFAASQSDNGQQQDSTRSTDEQE